MLDQVRGKDIARAARKVFPYDLIRIQMRGVEESRHAIFTGRFFRQYLEQEVRGALRDRRCRFPENLRVDVAATWGCRRGEATGSPWRSASQEKTGTAAPRPACGTGRNRQRAATSGSIRRASTSAAWWTCIAPRGCSAATTSPSPPIPRSTVRLPRARPHPVRPRHRRVPPLQRPLVPRGQRRRRVRHVDRPRRHEPGGPPHGRGAKLEPGDEIRFGRAVVLFEIE